MLIGEVQPGGELTTRLPFRRRIGDRVDQHLQAWRDRVVADLLGDHRGEVASCAVPGDGDVIGRHAPVRRLGDREPPRREGIVHRGRKPVLGCEPVVHREDVGPGGQRQPADEVVVADPVALHPASAVKEDDDADRVDSCPIPRRRDPAAGTVDDEILLDRHRRQLLGHRRGVVPHIGACLRDRFPGECKGGQTLGHPARQRHLRRQPVPVRVGAAPPAREAQQCRRNVSGTAHQGPLDAGGEGKRHRCGLAHDRERTPGAPPYCPSPPVSDSMPCPTA